MHAEIIAVGTEITSGAKLDTNSQWLSLELAAVGIPVHFHTTVADDLAEMLDVLRIAVDRADLVLITGGLGPTLDDLTRDALAQLMQCELVVHEPSLEFIRSLFSRRNIEMPERNRVQALFPEKGEPIPNPRGTAPGIWAEIARPDKVACRIAAMPGVPSEMKRMFSIEVLPRLPGGSQVIRRLRINCFGLGESAIEELLGDITARGRDPEVGITAHEATITLRIATHGTTVEECNAKIAATSAAIRERLGEFVFSEEDVEMQHVVVAMLTERGATLSTVESGTGGLLAHWLTDVREFERCYHGGTIVPSKPAKAALREIANQPVADDGPISEKVAGEMAVHCREQFGTDYALAVTAFPPYNPDAPPGEIPAGYIALAGPDLLKVRRHVPIGDLAILKSRAAKSALDLLRKHLLRSQTWRKTMNARLALYVIVLLAGCAKQEPLQVSSDVIFHPLDNKGLTAQVGSAGPLDKVIVVNGIPKRPFKLSLGIHGSRGDTIGGSGSDVHFEFKDGQLAPFGDWTAGGGDERPAVRRLSETQLMVYLPDTIADQRTWVKFTVAIKE